MSLSSNDSIGMISAEAMKKHHEFCDTFKGSSSPLAMISKESPGTIWLNCLTEGHEDRTVQTVSVENLHPTLAEQVAFLMDERTGPEYFQLLEEDNHLCQECKNDSKLIRIREATDLMVKYLQSIGSPTFEPCVCGRPSLFCLLEGDESHVVKAGALYPVQLPETSPDPTQIHAACSMRCALESLTKGYVPSQQRWIANTFSTPTTIPSTTGVHILRDGRMRYLS
ncbi:hypothetical protein TREMEDRAFT_60793 [Tremella mesenterica DSM 1558]|uniref:uncharacterized protein n=1 Tax=Tremella mesenterica (strain ATCC 24925 / CBS 8224 / DSM 1558 / NBRC 9311 / NRRL Y-6157 / RJB 2259-6 / UBC 559-6) TaxID=578456 RepID=UPI0003F493BD|nr:uncharacterized protein TREMEDRAFT_60793 [Tremella mesenterica DSM 1558]EIW71870.1 hypothetical protein TREMEDRAFT_60793 [Tremella mesenterica DSM 1558]